MKNPKTTTLGVITIVVALLNAIAGMINGHPVDMTTTVSTITAGIGLIAASDSATPPAAHG